ncbi:unnamed protein product [Rotaria sordida]|uniref:Uncharacterized protein n=1 Tax=Rotaria sordida TaxID=392033 RepID=A0A816AY21_9BILA|nr:unnamed protein product [Rotaria sordida]CAF1603200.1 unnamed protein product [Rotaria sordida]
MLQNEFYNILLIISSSDDNKEQLLFVKLQNYLSTFVKINLCFKKSDQCLSIITCLSNKSSIIISSSFFSNDDINKGKPRAPNLFPNYRDRFRLEISFRTTTPHVLPPSTTNNETVALANRDANLSCISFKEEKECTPSDSQLNPSE